MKSAIVDSVVPGSDGGDSSKLRILLLDYELARGDARSEMAQYVTAFAVLVSMITFIGAAIAKWGADVSQTNQYLLALMPLMPFALTGFLVYLGALATVRTYYLRGLEQEIQRLAASNIGAFDLPAFSQIGLVSAATSFRRGYWGIRLLASFGICAVTVILMGLTAYIGTRVAEEEARVLMACMYGVISAVLITQTVIGTIGGRGFFVRIVQKHRDSTAIDLLPQVTIQEQNPNRERTLFGYLVVPRLEDLVKLVFVPAAYLFGALTVGDFSNAADFFILWFILEGLLYCARYQINDVRGLRHDVENPEREARGRLPTGRSIEEARRNVLASLSIALFRVVIALAIGFSVDLAAPVLSIMAVMAASTFSYEWSRGKGSTIPNAEGFDFGIGPRQMATWTLVGFGYALRAAVGLYAASVPLLSPAGVSALLFFWVCPTKCVRSESNQTA